MIKSLASILIGVMTFQMALAQPPPNRSPPPAGGGGGGFAGSPGMPGNLFNSEHKVDQSTLKREWLYLPMGRGHLQTLVVHPAGTAAAPVVLLLHYDAGLDSFQQAMAVQLAERGFIAIAPDLVSGLGPEGGNFESFPFPDAALRAVLNVRPAEAMRRYKIAHAYAKTMPRANGNISALGAGLGGTHSFRLASEVPDLSAVVVFYGLPPDSRALGRITAPVLGLYGEDDPEIVATVAPTAAAMQRLGKVYESQVYPGATRSFMAYVVEGRNGEAAAAAWPAAIAFLNKYSTPSGR